MQGKCFLFIYVLFGFFCSCSFTANTRADDTKLASILRNSHKIDESILYNPSEVIKTLEGQGKKSEYHKTLNSVKFLYENLNLEAYSNNRNVLNDILDSIKNVPNEIEKIISSHIIVYLDFDLSLALPTSLNPKDRFFMGSFVLIGGTVLFDIFDEHFALAYHYDEGPSLGFEITSSICFGVLSAKSIKGANGLSYSRGVSFPSFFNMSSFPSFNFGSDFHGKVVFGDISIDKIPPLNLLTSIFPFPSITIFEIHNGISDMKLILY